jgi:acyl-CoA synthetase (AMP-forming)/AMP-acid ligase II
MMLADLYGKALAETPEKAAIIFKEQRLTFAQLDEMVRRSAAALADHGVGLGDRVALFMGNRPGFFALEFACFSLGAVCVPLNARSPSTRHRPSSTGGCGPETSWSGARTACWSSSGASRS